MLSRFSVKKPYTVFVAIIIVIILGVVSFTKMQVDLIPSFNLPYAVVVTTYPGASPEQVETVVTDTLETTFASLSNLKNISSVSAENMSLLIMEFNSDTNMDSALIEMRESLDMVSAYFPDEISSPMIMKLNPNMMPVMVTAASTENMEDAESADFIEEKIIPEIKSVSGVASVSATGLIENYVDVSISQEKLDSLTKKIAAQYMAQAQASGNGGGLADIIGANGDTVMPDMDMSSFELTPELIGGILSGQSFSMPAGTAQSADGLNYMVRVGDKINSIDELKQLVVFSIEGVATVTLDDVCDIRTYDNSDMIYSKINGNHGIMLTIQKQPDYSTTEVTNAVTEKMNELSEQENVTFTDLMNQGDYVNMMIQSILKNLISGGVLAIIILAIFLNKIKPTAIVGASIVISVITAFVLMYFTGVTLNMISMGGLALGVGMLVDNSIVVIENIFRHRSEGKSIKEAAIEGAKEVSGAIVASTLTTIVVFVPIVFTDGITRQLFVDMALTIGYSLVASLVVALTLVPAASSAMKGKSFIGENKWFSKFADWYTRMLGRSLKHKWVCIVAAVVLLAVSITGALLSGTEFFPQQNTGQISVNVELPEGMTQEEVFSSLDSLYETLNKFDEIETIGILRNDTSDAESALMSMMSSETSVYVLLKEEYIENTQEITDRISEELKKLPFEADISNSGMDMSALTGSAVSVNIFSDDLDTLMDTAKELGEEISALEGTDEIDNGLEETSSEYRIIVDKQKAISKGLTVAQVYMAVQPALAGETSYITINDGGTDYSVFVKDPRSEKLTVEKLGDLEVASTDGTAYKLSELAEITEAEGFASIIRSNQERTITVSGTLKSGYDVKQVNKEIQKIIDNYDFPKGTRAVIGGEYEQINDAFEDMFLMLTLAIIFIYLVMVAQFQSLKSPFIIMFTIPLAFTGGFLALLLTGNKVSVISLIGMVVLVGIVVNNGIVFVDYANQQREKGMSVNEALLLTGRNRIRPILMTALTTIIALMMMVFDTSSGGEMLRPLAITTVGGLTYATVLTLFLVPAMYGIFNKDKKKKADTDENAEAAKETEETGAEEN